MGGVGRSKGDLLYPRNARNSTGNTISQRPTAVIASTPAAATSTRVLLLVGCTSLNEGISERITVTAVTESSYRRSSRLREG